MGVGIEHAGNIAIVVAEGRFIRAEPVDELDAVATEAPSN